MVIFLFLFYYYRFLNKHYRITENDIFVISQEAPVITSLLQHMTSYKDDFEDMMTAMRRFIKEMQNILESTFCAEITNLDNTTYISQNDFDIRRAEISAQANIRDESLAELAMTGQYFPHFRVQRVFPTVTFKRNSKEKNCTKNYDQLSCLGPGVIFYFCLDHGTVIGFTILEKAESLQQVTNVILSRFSGLDLILYDNGCNLHEFMLNRYVYYT